MMNVRVGVASKRFALRPRKLSFISVMQKDSFAKDSHLISLFSAVYCCNLAHVPLISTWIYTFMSCGFKLPENMLIIFFITIISLDMYLN